MNLNLDIKCILCKGNDFIALHQVGEYKVMQCCRCQLTFVHPLPSREDHRKFHGQDYFRYFYGENIEEFYTNQGPLFQLEKQEKTRRLNVVRQFAPQGKRLLDVGTGQGLFPILAQELGFEAWATDVSSYVCQYLASKGIRILCGYLEDLPIPENYFDVVTLWHCLEHTFNPLTTLHIVYTALKPNGVVIIETPCTTQLEIKLRQLLNKPLFSLNHHEMHFYFFNLTTLSQLVEKAGFQVIYLGHRPIIRKTLRGKIIEFARNLLSATRFIDLRSTVFLVGRKPN